jgi:hypothetical protein
MVSMAVGTSGKKAGRKLRSPSLFSLPLLLAFNHSHPRPLLKSVDLLHRLM